MKYSILNWSGYFKKYEWALDETFPGNIRLVSEPTILSIATDSCWLRAIKSKESDYKNIIPEPFFNINVPISEKKTLIDCFDLYTEIEELGDDNKILNDETKLKENATKQILFWSLPNILVITIKRFLNNGRKQQSFIDFPIDNLDLSKYVVGYDKHSYVYDLYGICNHSGNTGGGHYYAYVKNVRD